MWQNRNCQPKLFKRCHLAWFYKRGSEKNVFETDVNWKKMNSLKITNLSEFSCNCYILKERSARECLFSERRQMKFFRPYRVCKCFIWVTNLGTIHEEVLPNCLDLPSKLRHFFQWWLAFKQHKEHLEQHKNQPKNSYKPADFRKILQFTSSCDLTSSSCCSNLSLPTPWGVFQMCLHV